MLLSKKVVLCLTQGPLWEWMRTLSEAGFVTDSGYTTSFRCVGDVAQDSGMSEQRILQHLCKLKSLTHV